MKKLFSFLVLVLLSTGSFAHPGIGIVKDKKGNIFYTDLSKVWKISPEGKRSIVVNAVHTHELYMDVKDDLYGEHLWYNGEAKDTWGHFVWCLRSNGQLDTVISPTEGFLKDYSFVRDQNGNMFWVSRGPVTKIRKKSVDGTITTVAESKFKSVRWMYSTREGDLYFVDLTDLYKVNRNGKLQLIASNLDGKTSGAVEDRMHHVMGIWTDKSENVYIAVLSENVVIKVSTDGKISNVVRTSGLWGPTGGVFDDTGNLWLLETNKLNEVRVRKIANNELGEKTANLSLFSAWIQPLIIALVALLVVIAILVFTNKKMRRTLSFSAALVALSFIACAQSEKEIEQIGKDLNDNKTSTTAVLSNEKYMALHSRTPFREAMKRYAKPEPIKITTDKEPGVKITVRAKLLDKDGKPATNAIVYVYQTDDKGWYSDTAGHVQQNEGDRRHARLFGYMKSNSEGKFEFQTIRPVGYPKSDLPAHIHLEVTTAEGGGITTELLFDEDPRLSNTQTRQRSLQAGFIIAKGEKENNNLTYNYEVKMNR